MKKWIYIWDSLCSDDFSILDVKFSYAKDWSRVSGELAKVIDPIYGKRTEYPIYEKETSPGIKVRIAFCEHTPGVYLAYCDEPDVAKTVEPKSSREIKFK